MPELRAVVTAEHAGNDVPDRWAPLFLGHEEVLASHRGWDPGSADLAEELASSLGSGLISTVVSRLLVEVNRSPGHPQVFSEITRNLPRREREVILDSYYRPHHRRVVGAIEERLKEGSRVLHLGVHTFTPSLGGQERNCDVAVLYDPRRDLEKRWSATFLGVLRELRPDLRLRRNYPYRGRADGLTTLLRRTFPGDRYLGIELEISQRFQSSESREWSQLRRDLVTTVISTQVRFAAGTQ